MTTCGAIGLSAAFSPSPTRGSRAVMSRMPPKTTISTVSRRVTPVGDPRHAAASRGGRLIIKEQTLPLKFNFDPISPEGGSSHNGAWAIREPRFGRPACRRAPTIIRVVLCHRRGVPP